MAEYTKDEALTFIEAMRRTLAGKVGFSWFVERLSDLSAYIETITAENERLKAGLDDVRVPDGESATAGEPADLASPEQR
jgi:hypothetical protein